ncbi:MAG: polysaccharide deacetylase [Pseudomonas sp.]|nr:polysaccharide deacetylase [Pseudomonas sp.]
MKDLLRSIAYQSGLLGLLHRCRNRHALTVLMFHRVLPDGDARLGLAERDFTLSLSAFQRVLDFVGRHYQVVRLEDVHRWAAGLGDLPPCPVLLTFDDGWRDTLLYAAPELQQRHWSAVLFLASEVPSLQGPRWWQDALVQAMEGPGARNRLWAAAGFKSVPPADASWCLTAHLAALPEPERLAWLDQHAPGTTATIQERQMLSTTELVQLEPASLEIAGHGHTHAPLTLAADPAAELQACHSMVKQRHAGVAAMSFPHGAWNPALVAQAREAGFELIFNSEPTLSRRASSSAPWVTPLGRIHLPESEWTCHKGVIDPPKLASFLFGRKHAFVPGSAPV